MTNNIYVFYNTLSRRYGDVIAYPSDDFAKARISNSVKAGKLDISELELCRVATIDISTGVITPCAPLRIDIPLDAPKMPVNPPDKEV